MQFARSLAHNTAIQIVGKAISTALGLVAVAVMTRTLGTEQFGWYVTATGFLQFIGILIDFGFTVTISNMLSEPAFEKEKLFNTVFTWRFLTALFFFGLAPFIFLFFPYPAEIKIAVAVTSLSFFCNTVNQVFIGYYRQKLSMFVATASEVIGRVILVAGISFFSYQGAGFMAMMSMITLASLGSTIYLVYNFGKIKFALDREISVALFYKIWPTAISVIFNSLYLQADRVILPLYVSQSVVGLYGAAYRVLDIVTQVAAIVMGMVMPLITYAWSRQNHEDFKERYQIGVDLLALILFPMVVGIFVLSSPIMRFIGGANFESSGEILKWLSISILGTSFGMTFGHIVLAINRQKQALLIYGTDALLSLIGYFIFIPRFGWQGAVAVTIFSEVYAGIGLTALTIFYSKVTPKTLTLLKIAFASIMMGSVVFLTHLSLLFSIVIGGMVYSLLIILLKVIKLTTVKDILRFGQVAE